MRLGFAVKPLGRPHLKSHDSRRWQNHPHLSVSLAYLTDLLHYLVEAGIGMYRMSPDLVPYSNHPEFTQFRSQVGTCAVELREIGDRVRAAGIRLSFHAGRHCVLNAVNPSLADRSAADLSTFSEVLDAMEAEPEAVIVVHLGGEYDDRESALCRFINAFHALPSSTKRRVVIENDDVRFSVSDTLRVHGETGVPVVFDLLHHRLNNPDELPVRGALASCLETWPDGVRAKVHLSSPRTEWRVDDDPSRGAPQLRLARWAHHADFVNPFEAIDFLRMATGLPAFDLMLEARARDLAVLQFGRDLKRYAPDLAVALEHAPVEQTTTPDIEGCTQ